MWFLCLLLLTGAETQGLDQDIQILRTLAAKLPSLQQLGWQALPPLVAPAPAVHTPVAVDPNRVCSTWGGVFCNPEKTAVIRLYEI